MPPQFTCLPTSSIGSRHHGTIHIGSTLDTMERAFDDAKYGWPSTEPILEITLPSSVDRTLAGCGAWSWSYFTDTSWTASITT